MDACVRIDLAIALWHVCADGVGRNQELLLISSFENPSAERASARLGHTTHASDAREDARGM
jgi:hypothetical protein